MPGRASGGTKQQEKSKKNQRVTLLNLNQMWFHSGEKVVSVEDATDAEFDQFIRQYVQMGWTLEERRDALNLALEQGQPVAFCEPPEEESHAG